MIAVSSSGASFDKLANYLVRDRTDGLDRVAWSATRNLPTDDVRLAAQFMRPTAAENTRVQQPVYHLTVSFHPDDVVTRPMMERVADRLLTDLKLCQHQVVIVAHGDRDHPHMHLMVNRIHPTSGRAWDRWQDWVVTQRAIREEELALGLRQVRGRLHQLDGQSLTPEQSIATSGEYRQALRSGVEPLVERVRAHAADLRAAVSWQDVHERLRAAGLRIERKGQGLVITDGEHQVKASRVHRELSFVRLERRLGRFQSIVQEHVLTLDRPRAITGNVPRLTMPDAQPDRVTTAADLARQVEYSRRLDALAYEIRQVKFDIQARVQQLELHRGDAVSARRDFDRALTQVYMRPDVARTAFERRVRVDGIDAAGRAMRQHPEAFGEVRSVEVKKYLGLVRVADHSQAMQHVPDAAWAGVRAMRAAEEHRLVVERSAGPRLGAADRGYESVLAGAQARLRHVNERLHRIHEISRLLPDTRTLERTLVHTISALAPPELRVFALAITAPQHLLAMTITKAARDIALGRERGLHL
jgi:Relaxase/Mobilisation nuclease domain